MSHILRVTRFVGVLAILAVSSWLAGLVSYRLALRLIFRQGVSLGDWNAVVFVSALVYFPIVALAYLPVLAWFDDQQVDFRRVVFLGVVGCFLALLPLTATGAFLSAGGGGTFFSPESLLFACLYGVAGGTFSMAYAVVSSKL